MTRELQALQDADFGWVHSLDGVWSDEGQIGGPNEELIDTVIAEFAKLTKSPNPIGRAFLGQAGIGKTHLVGGLRRRAWAVGGWFVMLDVIGITDFWKSAALSFVTSLLQEMPGGRRQYEAVIAGVARQFKVEKEVELAFDSPTIEPKKIVDLLLGALMKKDPGNALNFQDVFRALALLKSHDLATVGIAHAWLQGYEADEAMRRQLGFLKPPPTGIEIVHGLSWVMSLAGPTLIAVDQIDGVLSAGGALAGSEFGEGTTFAELLTGGLLGLTEIIRRGMIVMTALHSSWEVIRKTGPASLLHRFIPVVPLRLMQKEDYVSKLIADRLTPAYTKAGLIPKSPTDPFTAAAIRSASTGMTPRSILMSCDAHRKLCASRGKIESCHDLRLDAPIPNGIKPGAHEFDEALVETKPAIKLDGLFDEKDDSKLGMLLRDIVDIYAKQVPPSGAYDVVSKADPARNTPPLHARLTFVDHDQGDREQHFCFRALQHSSAVAVCARLRAALTASGISTRIEHRTLIIVRRGPPPNGPRTRELFEAFRKAGGIEIDPSDDDLRTFVTLRAMRDEALADSRFDAFERWLIERKPLCETAFFKATGLCPPPIPSGAPRQPSGNGKSPAGSTSDASAGSAPPGHATQSGQEVSTEDAQGANDRRTEHPDATSEVSPPPRGQTPPSAIPVGHRMAGGEPVDLQTNLLPRHTAIIAGAGSGKTVLLRRIVEEAALAGIPAIVIDPNNDLSRLGDAWPERPGGFTDEDAAKAASYQASVEVVIWTPGVHAGNPLFLSVLPDFAAIGDDPDERSQAVVMAADTLGPLAGAKTNLARGVLADALRHFAQAGGGDLKAMTALLAELPEGVSEIGNAEKIAGKMADELKAAVATNPLLKTTGPALDPRLLYFGDDPARTRVSVINLSGLASDDAKEDFVNRLQMTLFGWIKKHPSPHGMLYVIDEAQTFIPSGAGALSKTSGVQLVAQARKYGLGMIAVTQAPKGIDNKVVSNCTTHFLGKQNAPTTIEAAKELIAAAGGRADDMGKLATGEFYFKTEKSGKPFKVKTPICLSWHPPNPPAPEEVIKKAAQSRSRK